MGSTPQFAADIGRAWFGGAIASPVGACLGLAWQVAARRVCERRVVATAMLSAAILATVAIILLLSPF